MLLWQHSHSVFNSTSDDDSYAGASWPRRFSKPSLKPSPQGEGAERREVEEGVLRRALFPRMGQYGKQRPSSGLAALTHLPPRGKAALRGCKPSPQGEGAERREVEEGVLRRALFPRMGQYGKQRPSSGLAALTHLPKKGEGCASRIKPSPQGEGAERREAEEGYCAGRYYPEWGSTESNAPHPASLRSPTFPKRGEAALRGLSLPLRGKVPNEERRKRGTVLRGFF